MQRYNEDKCLWLDFTFILSTIIIGLVLLLIYKYNPMTNGPMSSLTGVTDLNQVPIYNEFSGIGRFFRTPVGIGVIVTFVLVMIDKAIRRERSW